MDSTDQAWHVPAPSAVAAERAPLTDSRDLMAARGVRHRCCLSFTASARDLAFDRA